MASGRESPSDYEFIELTNIGEAELDLSGARFVEGLRFRFPSDDLRSLLPAGGRVLVVADRFAFAARYPEVPAGRIGGSYSGRLAGGGEKLRLKDADGRTLIRLGYDDGEAWPEAADGAGRSLVRDESRWRQNPSVATSWRASTGVGGSPGEPEPVPRQAD